MRREVLNVIPVTHGVCSGVPGAAVGLPAAGDSAKVGYVRVITFNANTTLAVAQAVKEIKVSCVRCCCAEQCFGSICDFCGP